MGAAILVVEDDPSTLELVALGLEDAGYRALRAASAEEAEASLAAELPDGVVLDLVLPGPSGLALLRPMRIEERTLNGPALAVAPAGSSSDQRTPRHSRVAARPAPAALQQLRPAEQPPV